VAQEFRVYRLRRFGGVPPIPLDTATEAALAAGTLLEWFFTATVPLSATPAETVQAIRDHINAEEAVMSSQLGEELAYWGFEGESV
jgi:hypothetical protein